jgi:hypothetical protein
MSLTEVAAGIKNKRGVILVLNRLSMSESLSKSELSQHVGTAIKAKEREGVLKLLISGGYVVANTPYKPSKGRNKTTITIQDSGKELLKELLK